MVVIQIDAEQNFLSVVFAGNVTAGELAGKTPELTRLLGELRPGFRVLTDLSGLNEMALECAGEIQRLMIQLGRAGVSEVLRVIPDARRDIGFGIMSAFHYSPKVRIHTHSKREEALKFLIKTPVVK